MTSMRNFLIVIAMMTATGCAMDAELPHGSQDQASSVIPDSSQFCSDGIEPARCDGMSQADGDAYCNFICIVAGDIGGWCRHINPNESFHGLCVGGFPP